MSEYEFIAALGYKPIDDGENIIREEIVRCRDCIGLVETWDGWECERFSGLN